MYKGIDLNHLDLNGAQYDAATFIYPGVLGQTDPLFLGGNKNPYVAKIATQTRLGYTSAIQRPGDSVEPQFAENLHVFETSPVESALEIFYETSTSGLISELNTSIRNAEPSGVLTGISPIIFSLQEGDAVGTNATNVFEVMKGDGANQKIQNPLSNISLVRVFDGEGTNVTNKFEIVKIGSGSSGTSPTFAIRNTVKFVYTSESFNGDCLFEFTLRATCPDSEGTNVSKLFTFSNFRITNKKPILYSFTMLSSLLFNDEFGQTANTRIVDFGSTLDSSPYGEFTTSSLADIAQTGIGYSHTTKGLYIERENFNNKYVSSSTGNLAATLASASFVTNGFSTISSFSASTAFGTSSGVGRTAKQVQGLELVIKSVKRFSVGFHHAGSNIGKYYFPTYTLYGAGGTNSGVDKTHEFKVTQSAALSAQGLQSIGWYPTGQSKITKSELGGNPGGDVKAAWLFEIICYLEDAYDGSDGFGAGSKRSDDFRFHFIIHR